MASVHAAPAHAACVCACARTFNIHTPGGGPRAGGVAAHCRGAAGCASHRRPTQTGTCMYVCVCVLMCAYVCVGVLAWWSKRRHVRHVCMCVRPRLGSSGSATACHPSKACGGGGGGMTVAVTMVLWRAWLWGAAALTTGQWALQPRALQSGISPPFSIPVLSRTVLACLV